MKNTFGIDIIPENDAQRLVALHRYQLLDSPPEKSFNNLVHIIADVFDVPIALISLVDKERVQFKGNVGMPGIKNVDRGKSLCSLAVLSPEPTVITNALEDPCLLANPLVHGEFGLRFYAGAPLITPDGYNIGTICIIDKQERLFSQKERERLVRFSQTVMHEIELRQDARQLAHAASEDVAARLKAEEVKETLSRVLEALLEKGWTANERGEATYMTRGWYDYTGQTYGEAQGSGWTAVVHPDDVQKLADEWMVHVVAGQELRTEKRIRNKNGEYRWHRIRSVPIYDVEGNIVLWGGSCTDIHDRKVKEEKLEEQVRKRTLELERSNASLRDFAHVASHDLKEPIRKVSFYTGLLKSSMPPLNDKQAAYFQRVESALHRMGALIQDLLEYSAASQRPPEKEDIDLNVTLRRILEDLEVSIGEKKALITIDQLPFIKGFKGQLQQLFQNLVSNALKYSKPHENPEISITAGIISGNNIPLDLPGEEQNRHFHLIEVRDNGIGFEQQYANRIFQMFQRLHGKDQYAGTGIGLSIARKVAENHHGFIWAESKPGEGSVFNVVFPIE